MLADMDVACNARRTVVGIASITASRAGHTARGRLVLVVSAGTGQLALAGSSKAKVRAGAGLDAGEGRVVFVVVNRESRTGCHALSSVLVKVGLAGVAVGRIDAGETS
jgi:hypothetical protein